MYNDPTDYRESDFICRGQLRVWNEDGSDFEVLPFDETIKVEQGSSEEVMEAALAEELKCNVEDLINVNYK